MNNLNTNDNGDGPKEEAENSKKVKAPVPTTAIEAAFNKAGVRKLEIEADENYSYIENWPAD